jgi:hypothetical protein
MSHRTLFCGGKGTDVSLPPLSRVTVGINAPQSAKPHRPYHAEVHRHHAAKVRDIICRLRVGRAACVYVCVCVCVHTQSLCLSLSLSLSPTHARTRTHTRLRPGRAANNIVGFLQAAADEYLAGVQADRRRGQEALADDNAAERDFLQQIDEIRRRIRERSV